MAQSFQVLDGSAGDLASLALVEVSGVEFSIRDLMLQHVRDNHGLG